MEASDHLAAIDYRAEARRELHGWLTNWGPTIEAMIAGVLEAVDEIDLGGAYPEDEAMEIAGGAVPIYTHEIMKCAAESAEIFAGPDDRGLLGDDATPEQQIMVALYELASNIASARLHDRLEDASRRRAA